MREGVALRTRQCVGARPTRRQLRELARSAWPTPQMVIKTAGHAFTAVERLPAEGAQFVISVKREILRSTARADSKPPRLHARLERKPRYSPRMTIPTELLCSPDGQPLEAKGDSLVSGDGRVFPIVDGVPVLLSADRSVFSAEEVAGRRFTEESTSVVRKLIRRFIPAKTLSIGSAKRYSEFARRINSGRVLVIGAGRLGQGADPLIESGLELIESDVYLSPRVDVVCDGHDLPFRDETFDGVVLQAVLEHVLDPPRVISEAHRVLRPGGLIYAESPFLAAVHEGPFDFLRWTELGHRRLFRMFTELERGVVSGPATTLVWALCYFARSIPRGRSNASLVFDKIATLMFFWLKYFDYVLVSHPGATDGAFGTYFMGRKSSTAVSDAEILSSYGGTVGRPVRRDH